MKREELKRIFNKIKENTNGNNTSNSDIIDYKNGNSITIEEVENEYYKYLELINTIDEYIEIEDLDDVSDSVEIKEHFKDIIDEDLFMFDQACLKDFTDYMTIKINKNI